MLFQRLFPSSLFSWPLITILIKEKNLSTCLDLIVSRGEARERVDGEGGERPDKSVLFFFPQSSSYFSCFGALVFMRLCVCSCCVLCESASRFLISISCFVFFSR